MSEEPKRLNHPVMSYVIGLAVICLAVVVFMGVAHHLTFSHHGPGLLHPVKSKYLEEEESFILDESRRLEELEEHRHFHQITTYSRLPEEKSSVCYICHSDYPHTKTKKVRGMMNMHTDYFTCETCHIQNGPGSKIIYKWCNPLDDDPKGPFSGTSYDPETGILVKGDPFSKIAPYIKYDLADYSSSNSIDNIVLAVKTQDAPLARDFARVRDKLSPEQRDAVKVQFHENIKPKGHDCEKCHTENSIFDFKQLGFSDNRISDLKNLEAVGMVTKYDEFFFPTLLEAFQ